MGEKQVGEIHAANGEKRHNGTQQQQKRLTDEPDGVAEQRRNNRTDTAIG